MVYSAEDKLYREGMTLSDEFALSSIRDSLYFLRRRYFETFVILNTQTATGFLRAATLS